MGLIGITDELFLKLLLKKINQYLEESNSPRAIPKEIYDTESLLRFKKLNEKIKKFIIIFQNNFTPNQINNMLNRLETLTIIEKEVSGTYFKYLLGEYEGLKNRITLNYFKDKRIDKKIEEETLYHELIHMASTRVVQQRVLTGFEIPDYLGLSLNEGYTEYITEKYFTRGMEYVYSDNDDMFYAKGIENIVGKEKMEELFFNADLEGLIKEISKYIPRMDVIKLLFFMDRQHQGLRKSRDKKAIIEQIAKIVSKKLLDDYQKGLITYEEYQIEYAKKVEGYRSGVIWSEETKVIKDNGVFILYDQGESSVVYELKEKTSQKQKKYQ